MLLAILTFLTYAHMPSVMLCVHCPFNHTSEANSLLALPSFRSWMIILISCHRALFTGTETGTPCISTTEVWSTELVVKHKKEGQHRQCIQSWVQLRSSRNTEKLNAQRSSPWPGQHRASVDICLGKSKWGRELHHEGQDFTLVPSRSSRSNGVKATAKE